MNQKEPEKFCPFASVYESGPAGSWVKKLMPCDLEHCALGVPEMKRCALKDLAGTSNALYLIHGNQHVQDALVIQTIRDLTDRLDAVFHLIAAQMPSASNLHKPDAPRSDEPPPSSVITPQKNAERQT